MGLERVSEQHRRDSAGIRFSWMDTGVLAATAVLAMATWHLPTNPSILLLTVVGHFLLFCNVVRLRRSFELVWALAYVAATFGAIALGVVDWTLPLLAVTPITIMLVVIEVRSMRYHGIGWRKINPGWAAAMQTPSSSGSGGP